MKQKPAYFNYATKNIIKSKKSCVPIKIHPALEKKKGFEKWTPLDPIALPGGNGATVDYCAQLSEFKIDFHKSNAINLPPELGNRLDPQEIGLKAKVCAGIACESFLRSIDLPDLDRDLKRLSKKKFKGIKKSPLINNMHIHCFCLELYATLKVIRDSTFFRLDVTGLELKDIKPDGLQNSLECFMMKLLDHTVLPQLKIALSDLALGVEDYFSIIPTPISTTVPFNPSIKDNSSNIYANIN